MDEDRIRIFGIRHHGPGCARSLSLALEDWQPDCILLEGPPEGESVLSFLADETMVPPVALLVYAEEDARFAAFFPFTEYSPEWRALRYAQEKHIPLRFMDLSAAVDFAEERDREKEALRLAAVAEEQQASGASDVPPGEGDPAPEEAAASEEASAPEEDASSDMPEPSQEPDYPRGSELDELAALAGYENGEAWWNAMIEERLDGLELFEVIRDLMREMRAERERSHAGQPERERRREAHMRTCLRRAKKEGFERIAVICGAWHVPALEADVPARADNACLKGLSRMKVVATWVPWSYADLSMASGYRAGVHSPAWYEHVMRGADMEGRAVSWLTMAARLFREEGLDCSPAHIIESARLAGTLAALRQRPGPGLPELYEALQTVVCMGEEAPMRLIEQRLIIGEKLGHVPEQVPMVPLQKDIERCQKKLRLKPEASQKLLDLDLRQEKDLERSRMLHRLQSLDIPWGTDRREGGGKGTFHELWQLQWEPRLIIDIIRASHWGNTLKKAAEACTKDRASRADLAELVRLVDVALLADLDGIIDDLAERVRERAALATDTLELLSALPELVRLARYGDVRGTDTGMVLTLVEGMVPRVAVGLHAASSGLDEDSSRPLGEALRAVHESLRLMNREDLSSQWHAALRRLIPEESGVHACLRGLATRLLFDDDILSAEEVATQMGLALSPASEPEAAAAWLSSFLGQSAMLLMHDDGLWGMVDAWLAGLSDNQFTAVLPMLRRTFTGFSAPERRQLAERARRAPRSSASAPVGKDAWDEARAVLPLPLLRRMLGLAAEPEAGR
ncbi:DUF5682 family protein [uncultured Mailhella sp.]|uniref:DUF5682 family protein n=1 Tax=uncultured Mailhella sp. TaxID=1981031 RepID=UPI0025D81C17|nr:DUF5682 family protein [uncultured Mailhella sp.]